MHTHRFAPGRGEHSARHARDELDLEPIRPRPWSQTHAEMTDPALGEPHETDAARRDIVACVLATGAIALGIVVGIGVGVQLVAPVAAWVMATAMLGGVVLGWCVRGAMGGDG